LAARTFEVLGIALITVLVCCVDRADAGYTFATLDVPGASSTSAAGVAGGVIVGSYNDSAGHGHGFRYDGSSFATLNTTLGSVDTNPQDLAAGTIVGWFTNLFGSPAYRPFRYIGSSWIPLDVPGTGGGGARAYGIEGNLISGYYLDNFGISHGFTYNTASLGYTRLDDPSVPQTIGFGTRIYKVSGGIFVGTYFDSAGIHGFTYNGSVWKHFDDPLAINGTWGQAISGTNVVGFFTNATGDHGYLYDGTKFTTLDAPGAVNGTYLYGISGDTIVGSYVDNANVRHGLIVTIPEPTSVAMLGLLGVYSLRGRRRKA
jgi:hypothetical protein